MGCEKEPDLYQDPITWGPYLIAFLTMFLKQLLSPGIVNFANQFTFITQRPFWSPWGIKALSLHCLCPSSLTLNERLDGQNLLFGQ